MKKEKEQTVNEVKSLLILVDQVAKANKFASFDYGKLLKTGQWECSFWFDAEAEEPDFHLVAINELALEWLLNRML